MYATAVISVEKKDNALLIPTDALVVEKVRKSVFTIADNKAKKVSVKVGFDDGDSVEVLDGLTPDKPVITVGKQNLNDGQRVLVLGDEPPRGIGTWSCAFSPDGKMLLAAGDGLRAWELPPGRADTPSPTFEAHPLFNEPGAFRNLLIHPTGKWSAFQGSLLREGHGVSGSFIRGLQPKNETELAYNGSVAVQTLGLVDDGRSLLSFDIKDLTLRFWEVQSRRLVRTIPTLGAGESSSTLVANMRVSPDGTKVAVVNYNGLGVNIYLLASGRRLYSLPEEPGSLWWLAWAPDNRHLAVSRSNGDISLWNLNAVEAVLRQAGLEP